MPGHLQDDFMEVDETNAREAVRMLENLEAGEDQTEFQERNYQTYLVQLAKKRNIIVCLPTGSGKTFIALQLTKDYLPQAKREERKIIFLANTVPLVNQQAEFFRTNLSNTYLNNLDPTISHVVDCLTGDRNVDVWKGDKWIDVLNNCVVMVMTTQIFIDALNHGFITFEKVKLLILDECHHTVKDSAMSQVMTRYREIIRMNDGVIDLNRMPRILGLTATIILGKKSVVDKEVRDAEERLCAKAVTYHEYEEVLLHSTSAEANFIRYEKNEITHWHDYKEYLEGHLKAIVKMVLNTREKLTTEEAPDIDHESFQREEQRFNSKDPPQKFLKTLVNEVLDVCEDLGLYCARTVAINKRAYLHTVSNSENRTLELLTRAVDSALELFIVRAERVMASMANMDQLTVFITNKVKQLLLILEGYKSADKSLSGLIFTERRVSAQSLCWYLQDLAAFEKFNFLKVGFIVGSSTYGMDPVEQRITVYEQRSVIRKFRKKEYNLLVATRVLEEGLDVPSCNLVIRIDKIQTYPSYVQSMGRARHKNSKFLGFIDRGKEKEEIGVYEDFEKYNKRLSNYLRENALHADDQFGEKEEMWRSPMEQPVMDFEPFPGQPPRIAAIEAISITQRYCQLLSCDKFAILSPVYWWDEVGTGKTRFKAFVQFPINSVIREIVEGHPQETKILAKRSAAIEACKLLYARGQLNERLLPTPRGLSPRINQFIDAVETEKVESESDQLVGSKKRTQWYLKKIPHCLEEATLQPETVVHAYGIRIELLPKQIKSSLGVEKLYQFRSRNFIYCILTPVNLTHIPQFLLHVNSLIGNIVVTLEDMKLGPSRDVRFNHQELEKLYVFHRHIFGELLKLKRSMMKNHPSPILIAPVQKEIGDQKKAEPETYRIDWDLMDRVTSVSEDFFKPPPDEERKKFHFDPDRYMDSIVIPWYREPYRLFHVVLEIWDDSSPLHPFPYNKQYANYEQYFIQKYSDPKTNKYTVTFIGNKEQKLLKAKMISSNLNFFRSDVNYKKSQAERKDNKERLVEMLPELTNVHPLPASLYIQAKFLPTIWQRICRFLCAGEILSYFARETPWASIESVLKDYNEELEYLMKSNPLDPGKGPVKRAKPSKLGDNASVSDRRLNLDSISKEELLMAAVDSTKGHKEIAVAQTSDVASEEVDYVLEYIHPKNITYLQLKKIQERQERFGKVKMQRTKDEDPGWHHEIEVRFEMVDINSIQFSESLDKEFTFQPDDQPSMYMIMQSITMESSLDSVNLERLEMIGDSVLKYCVSRHIFVYFPNDGEGVMTQLRSRLISNRHLYSLGRKLYLGEYLAGGFFKPESAWLPPALKVPERMVRSLMKNKVNDDVFDKSNIEDLECMTSLDLDKFVESVKDGKYDRMPAHVGYAHARVPDKAIADSVEALIGAYFVKGGIGGALHAMEKIGLRGPIDSKDTVSAVPLGQWSSVSLPQYNPQDDTVENHLSDDKVLELEKLLCYRFKNRWLLLEAFSHPGYLKNRVTGCYQRLEFLGDAVLDFLVTNHIYKMNNTLNPGQLTDLRAALVNNVTFGSLAVRYGLDTYLLHTSKSLVDAISHFAECQRQEGHNVTGHFELLSDDDCALVSDVDCPKVLGDIFESLAGALYVDSGFSLDTTWKVFYRLMKNEIDTFSVDVPKSPVRELHEENPARKIFCDITKMVEDSHPNRAPGMFYYALKFPINDQKVVGMGRTKESAKLAVAKYAKKLRKSR